ncbi:hypothetical protein [Tardiphaga sp.]|jgi:hypothetical protein|uniref:hypothetical protein n=1 Tax=Tardiphaga sp. TaxID=1926292 RepID=UPI0037D9A324
MSHRRHGNDNIRTSHLKCDRCRTRIKLKAIDQFDGFETRSFSCDHCGAVKLVRVDQPLPLWQQRVGDHTSC